MQIIKYTFRWYAVLKHLFRLCPKLECQFFPFQCPQSKMYLIKSYIVTFWPPKLHFNRNTECSLFWKWCQTGSVLLLLIQFIFCGLPQLFEYTYSAVFDPFQNSFWLAWFCQNMQDVSFQNVILEITTWWRNIKSDNDFGG